MSTTQEPLPSRVARAEPATEGLPGAPAAEPLLPRGCWNPALIAGLRPGETALVVDAQGGLDCFVAAHLVGGAGRVVAVTRGEEAVCRARVGAERHGLRQLSFRRSEHGILPAAVGIVDAVVLRCALSGDADPEGLLHECRRVLRRGGRLAASELVRSALPEQADASDAALRCLAGTLEVAALRRLLKRCGFVQVQLEVDPDSADYLSDWAPGSGLERLMRTARILARAG